jgi:NAD+ synthase (glutamine-hydrolysing)
VVPRKRPVPFDSPLRRSDHMRVSLLQTSPVVGAIADNTVRLLEGYTSALSDGADLVVAPELAVCGYPPRDLLERADFLDACDAAVRQIVAQTGRAPFVFGAPVRRDPALPGKALANAAFIACEGKLVAVHHKTLLPTYDVFDEARYFEPGSPGELVHVGGYRVAVSICEDMWNDDTFFGRSAYAVDPFDQWQKHGVDLVLNLSASPFHKGKPAFREQLAAHVARRMNAPVVYVNQSGANDELVFDGHSFVCEASGEVRARLAGFAPALQTVDLSQSNAPFHASAERDELGEVWQALVLGLRDYLSRTGFRTALLGLSGGIDSALTAALAVDALGAANVLGVAMPSRYSSEHSVADARELAANLGIELWTLPIEATFSAFLDTLAQPFAGKPPDVTEENLQARCRGTLLMAISNKTGRLLLSTGNKSETAVGYSTLYGDMCGGIAVISDVPKTLVYALCRWRNRNGEVIPESTIVKPPSAELRPNQLDQDSLPPYDVLDAIIEAWVERCETFEQIVAGGHDPATVTRVIRLVERAEYKRRQAAPGIRVTSRAFGVGRRYPVATGFSGVPSKR